MSEDGWWSVDYPLSEDLQGGQQKNFSDAETKRPRMAFELSTSPGCPRPEAAKNLNPGFTP
jgi:hypothetical protein